MASLWDTLPPELQDLVLQHRAASRVQREWVRYTHYRHARRADWSGTRRFLTPVVVRTLAPYADVRREWRREASSWNGMDRMVLSWIVRETRLGLWGARSPRL